MALSPISAITITSGDAWTTLVDGPAVVTQAICSNQSFGRAAVSLRVQKDGVTAYLVPNDFLPWGATCRFRVGALALSAGDKLEAKSIGSVDWSISGMTA